MAMKLLFLTLFSTVALTAQVSGLGSAWGVLNRAGDYSNNETQCYTPNNVAASNSNLVLTFQSQSATCGDSDHSSSGFSYTSGNVYWTSFSYQYGTLEFKGSISSGGTSAWPAIWMLGTNCQATWGQTADNKGSCSWPNAGSEEVDVMEYNPQNSTEGYNIYTSSGTYICTGPTKDSAVHTWQYIWTSTSSTWKRDGTSYCATSNSNYRVNDPMWLIIQSAARSGNSPVNHTVSLDYVKVTASDGVTVLFYDDFTGATTAAGVSGSSIKGVSIK